MKFKNKEGVEVYFDNGHKVGIIKYDEGWRCWRIEFEKNVRLQKEYILEIYKFMKREL